ncbi:MAG: hypothetical protein HYZ90_02040 [Candidatus Omnitrophica bacterium]|nr:hypothetical protein [Candidatus Omnitrophota bacterium]
MSETITFDKAAKHYILEAFGLGLDKEGYIVERDNPSQKVLTVDGDEITEGEFAGIKKGSLLFFKSDLPSLIELADRL